MLIALSASPILEDIWSDKSQETPQWVVTEQDAFRNTRDANKDGYLDREEVRNWIFPKDYDHSESEMKHLLSQSDDNRVSTTSPLTFDSNNIHRWW